ncbi:MAG: DUF4158 domain-containing protein [Mesorhizobium sp.]|nr:DUF4158 domain-containing protein [Mesorhizobium sp.]RWM87059.1 MAG: DUF4158 domain-containing protein [Mesorhizobium sp.]
MGVHVLPVELAKQWSLSFADMEFVNAKPTATRLGLAGQLKFFAAYGFFATAAADIPDAAVTYLAEQLGVSKSDLLGYDFSAAQRRADRRRHSAEMAQRDRHPGNAPSGDLRFARLMAKVERVLIVGGGLAGLALMIALRQRGLPAAMVERASDRAVPGAGLYLIGSATRALRALGVADHAARNGCVIRTQRLFNHRGMRLAEIDAGAFWEPCGPRLGIAHSDLRKLLTQQAKGSYIRLS